MYLCIFLQVLQVLGEMTGPRKVEPRKFWDPEKVWNEAGGARLHRGEDHEGRELHRQVQFPSYS